ncbi:hypothetical protein TNCV_3707911 [Trichonephila clavipes]|nr:hypothetical protein TNCV_3707911 [Trichonephila clavipes]
MRFCSVPAQFRGGNPGGIQGPSTNHTRGLVARRLLRVPPCRKGTIHLQTSLPSPGFEPSPYGTAVSVANHYTGWVTERSVERWATVLGTNTPNIPPAASRPGAGTRKNIMIHLNTVGPRFNEFIGIEPFVR